MSLQLRLICVVPSAVKTFNPKQVYGTRPMTLLELPSYPPKFPSGRCRLTNHR
jgi:hypothetical protein